MSIAVVGCGRSGTNMVLEILSGNSTLTPSPMVENKHFFKSGEVYPPGYLTKCDTVYFNMGQFSQTMDQNPDLQIVWTIRDPRDMILSKLRRGQTRAQGGDNKVLADDGTPDGCIKDIEQMMVRFRHAMWNYPSRVKLVKMEDFIVDIEKATLEMCQAIDIPFEPAMLDFMSRMRNQDKVKRYKGGVDKGELEKWKTWESCYDGFFVKEGYNIPGLFYKVAHVVEEFDYGL